MEKKKNFKHKVWEETKKETFGSFRATLFAIIVFIVVAIARILVFGKRAGMTYIEEFFIDFFIAGGLFTLVFFFINLIFRAPYAVGKKQTEDINDLEEKLKPASAKIFFDPQSIDDDENDEVDIDLTIVNQESVEIKNCYVSIDSLIQLFQFPKGNELYEISIKHTGRLGWKGDYASKDGKHTVPLLSSSEKVYVAILDIKTCKLKFVYNKDESNKYDINQVFLLKLRLDGQKAEGKDIDPKYFEGYLFITLDSKVSSVIRETYTKIHSEQKVQRERIINMINKPIIAFGAGDWRKDERIPLSVREYKILPARYLQKSKTIFTEKLGT